MQVDFANFQCVLSHQLLHVHVYALNSFIPNLS